MDRKDAQMQKILPALAFAFAAQAALADQLPAGHDERASRHADGLMHAGLVVPAQGAGGTPHGAAPAALKVSLPAGGAVPPATGKEPHDDHRSAHTTGMLLAGLALMAGIVLRRWGSDPQ